ncbi:MAG: nucleoside deaminase [Fuerstiella sp.]
MADRFTVALPDGWSAQLPAQTLWTDADRMQFVLGLAEWNIQNHCGGPFAAAVFERSSGDLVSIGVNQVVPQDCSLAHAEAMAVALAQQSERTYDLSADKTRSFDLYTSGQPCVQCFGMVWWSGITRLVVGARATDIEELTDFQEGPLPEDWKIQLQQRSPLPSVEVVCDVCRQEARDLLRRYQRECGPNYSPGCQPERRPGRETEH